MPIVNEWLVQNRVVLSRLQGVVLPEEIKRSNIEIINQCKSMKDKSLIHGIIDMRHADVPIKSINLREVSALLNKDSSSELNMGWMIAISENRLLNFVFSIAMSIYSGRMRIFKTLEEAITFLQDVDSTLPVIPPIPTLSNTVETTAD